MKKSDKNDGWAEAKRICRLSAEDVEMAKKLGFAPKSLIKNVPSPSQRWKAPVREWVRDLYEEKVWAGCAEQCARGGAVRRRNGCYAATERG